MQTFSAQFEMLKMKEDEYIATYFLTVYEKVNSMQGLGATIEEYSILQNILRTLLSWFSSKVSALEDRSNLEKLTKDELCAILIAYEMRIEPKNVSRKEATFKSTRKPKTNKNYCNNIVDMYDEEEDNFVRKLKRWVLHLIQVQSLICL